MHVPVHIKGLYGQGYKQYLNVHKFNNALNLVILAFLASWLHQFTNFNFKITKCKFMHMI